jgi:inner membrane protein
MEDRQETSSDSEVAGAGGAAPTRRQETGGGWSGPTVKFFVIAFLVGLLMVPLLFVWALSAERDSRRHEVLSSIERDWGGAQSLRGPFLLVPATTRRLETRDGASSMVATDTAFVVVPDMLSADVATTVSTRRVSIYDAPVYSGTVVMKAAFPAVTPALFNAADTVLHWNRAKVAIGIPSIHGIEEVDVTVAGRVLRVEPTIGLTLIEFSGIHAPFPADLATAVGLPAFAVELTLRLRGSGSIAVDPLGRETTVTMTSNWPHPSFPGYLLPSENTVTTDGFTAVWRVPYLARSMPQAMRFGEFDYLSSLRAAGVTFGDPIDTYRLMDRALKYGIMFVAAIFYVVFFLEVLSNRRIHVVQYCIVGMISVFFYVLLLALAEQVPFAPAYMAASAATGGVISTFVGVALGSRVRAAIAGAAFAALFALLFAILRLEDVALLGGALFGFVVLTIGLFASRRVDWSGRAREPAAGPANVAAA